MEKIYIVWATYHNLDDYTKFLGAYKNEIIAADYARKKQNEISVDIVELYITEEILKDTY